MTTVNELVGLHSNLLYTDEQWSDTLQEAFGKDAGDRRYDNDKSSHPIKCQTAYLIRNQASEAFEKAGGFAKLFNHSQV